MKAKIEVTDRKEARLIRAGLADRQTRTLVKVMGALAPLSRQGKIRALRYVDDMLAEKNGESPRRL